MWQKPNASQTTSDSKDNIKAIGDKRKSVRVLWAHIANVFIALYGLLTFQCFPVKRGEVCGWSAFPGTGAQASPLWVAPKRSTSSRLVFSWNFEEMYNWDRDNVPELQYETERKPLLTWTDYCVRLPVSAELRSVLWLIFCLIEQLVTLFSFKELLSAKTLHTITQLWLFRSKEVIIFILRISSKSSFLVFACDRRCSWVELDDMMENV